MSSFTKHPREPQSALAEAAGLRWLRQGSNCVVEVLSASENHIETAMVKRAAPTPNAARTAGRELAAIHRAGASAYGSPPEGWDGLNYIGTQTQPCEPTQQWAQFYVEQRVLVFVQRAVDNGNLTAHDAAVVGKACDWILDHAEELAPDTPARIHGDLWSGNLMFGVTGPVFIDPAAHGGHPETDLAMLALFGAPYLDEIIAGYQEVSPLSTGWVDRIPLHQLHPLAVHAVTHGPSYGRELVRAARHVLEI